MSMAHSTQRTLMGQWGSVMRDEEGEFIAARARWYDDTTDALIAEAWACRDGVQFETAKVIVETDS